MVGIGAVCKKLLQHGCVCYKYTATVSAEYEPKQPEESDGSNQPDASLSEEDESLPACLALCEVSQAPTASSLKKDLIQKIGKPETHLVLRKLHQKV